jgi:hypothetical protein
MDTDVHYVEQDRVQYSQQYRIPSNVAAFLASINLRRGDDGRPDSLTEMDLGMAWFERRKKTCPEGDDTAIPSALDRAGCFGAKQENLNSNQTGFSSI